MKKIKEILKKIRKYFKQIFNRNCVKLIEASEELPEEVINSKYIEENTEKKDFFIIYENIKKGIIKPSDLMLNDLIKLQLVMQEELDIFDKKIEIFEKEIIEMEKEITILKNQNSEYIFKLDNES